MTVGGLPRRRSGGRVYRVPVGVGLYIGHARSPPCACNLCMWHLHVFLIFFGRA